MDFMTEPWSEEARLRAGWAVYQLARGTRVAEEVYDGQARWMVERGRRLAERAQDE